MTPEFSRPERLDAIGAGERSVTIAADADERRRLATRFDLLSLDRLEAALSVRRDTAGVAVTGRVTADAVQACTVTGDPLPVHIDEPIALRFVDDGESGEDVELDANALDTLPIEGGAIDLGEAAAETVALALDPFPRGPGAAAALREAGVLSEEEARPLGGLAALKGLLSPDRDRD